MIASFLLNLYVLFCVYRMYRIDQDKTVYCLSLGKWYEKKGIFIHYKRFYTYKYNWLPLCTCTKAYPTWFGWFKEQK